MTRCTARLLPAALLAAACALAPSARADWSVSYHRAPAPPRQDGLFDRVQQDLDRAAATPYIAYPTRDRIDHARKQIWRFQHKWSEGQFDKGRLDDAISAVHHVVESASLDYRDRRTLQNDLGRMREFRAERGYALYGANWR